MSDVCFSGGQIDYTADKDVVGTSIDLDVEQSHSTGIAR
jgi:hypothetical protein